jgi:hypothetical protein
VSNYLNESYVLVWLTYLHNQGLAYHNLPPVHHPMLLVTACVDKIGLSPLRVSLITNLVLRVPAVALDKDLILEGHVSWVGTSSMEATMQCVQQHDQTFAQVLEAKFVMVALDPSNTQK